MEWFIIKLSHSFNTNLRTTWQFFQALQRKYISRALQNRALCKGKRAWRKTQWNMLQANKAQSRSCSVGLNIGRYWLSHIKRKGTRKFYINQTWSKLFQFKWHNSDHSYKLKLQNEKTKWQLGNHQFSTIIFQGLKLKRLPNDVSLTSWFLMHWYQLVWSM